MGTGLLHVGGYFETGPGSHVGNGRANWANPKLERRAEPEEVDPVGGVGCADLWGARCGHDVGHGSRRRRELSGQGNDGRVVGQGGGCSGVRTAILTATIAWGMAVSGAEGDLSPEVVRCYV